MLIGQILASKGAAVVTTKPDASVAEAVKLLKEKGIGSVVVSEDGSQIAGIFSERDVARGLAEHGASVLDRPVSDLMTRDVKTCTPDDGVEKLMQDMTSGRFRHMPVVQGGRMVGLVSIGDVVKHRLHELESESHMLQDYIAGSG